MVRLLYLFLFLMLLTLMSCGEKADNSTENIRGVVPIKEKNEEFEKALLGQYLSCDSDHTTCPENVGRILVLLKGGEYTSCTGFLVSEDTVMTNSHCLPRALVNSEDCSDKLMTVFRRSFVEKDTGLDKIELVKVRCKRILEHHPSPLSARRNDKDYAFIQLEKKLDIEPVTRNMDGVPANREFQVWSVRSDDLFKSSLVTHHCRSIEKNYITPQYRSAISSIVSFKNCPIDKEHNGSPVFDHEGQVRALISGGNDDLINELGTIVGNHRIGVAVNFACVKSFMQNPEIDESCERLSYDEAQKLRVNEMHEELQQKRVEEFNTWSYLNPHRHFKWSLIREGNNWVAIPLCVKSEKQFRKDYGVVWKYFPRKEDELTVKIKMWKDYGPSSIDQDLKTVYTTIAREGHSRVHIFPKELIKNDISFMRFNIFDTNLLRFLGRDSYSRNDLALQFCPDSVQFEEEEVSNL